MNCPTGQKDKKNPRRKAGDTERSTFMSGLPPLKHEDVSGLKIQLFILTCQDFFNPFSIPLIQILHFLLYM